MMQLPQTPSFRLDGKKALVTGGSSGIGLGCAVALAAAGADVMVAARGQERVDEAVSAMQAAGLSAQRAVLDQSDVTAIRDLVEGAGYDIVVNSAGYARHKPALEIEPEDFDIQTNVNLRGAFFLSQAAAKDMMARGVGGSIIHISSQMGHTGGFDRAVYCSNKHGMEGMIKVLAMEWGKQGIRVNTICPTFIKTPLTEQTLSRPERLEWIMSRIKLDRLGEVEDMMGPVLFLASEASALMTGTHMILDGGWVAG